MPRASFPRALLLAPLLALLLLAPLTSQAGKGPEPVESVHFARTWETALEVAQLLNVPIVVHSHKFT